MNSELIAKANELLHEAYASEPKPKINSPSDAWALPAVLRESRKTTERFMVVTLNGAHEVIKVRVLTIGLINRTVIHPREFLRPAILDNSAAVIAIHNHPSGRLEPSPEDKEITSRLKDACDLIGIPLLDHLIVSTAGYFSFVEHGLLVPANTN